MKHDKIGDFRKFSIRVKLLVFGYFQGSINFLTYKVDDTELSKLLSCVMKVNDSFDSVIKRLIHQRFSQKDLYWEQVRVDAQVENTDDGSVLTIGVFAAIDHKTFLKELELNKRAIWRKTNDTDSLLTNDAALVFQAFSQLQERARFLPLGFYLLGNAFTYYQLQKLFEHVLDEIYDRPNFRRKMKATGLIEPIEIIQDNVQHRPAQLYRFNQEKYELIKQRGFEFRF
ncbi:MAG: hypothetical protein JXQ87_01470 [Bacteroidia bacterium]